MPEYLRLRFGLVQGTKLDKLYCFKVRWTKNSCLSVSLGTPSLCLHQNFGKCLLILIPPCWSQFVTPCHFQAYVVQQRIDTDSLILLLLFLLHILTRLTCMLEPSSSRNQQDLKGMVQSTFQFSSFLLLLVSLQLLEVRDARLSQGVVNNTPIL